MKKMTNVDIGERGGSKISVFAVTTFLNCSIKHTILLLKQELEPVLCWKFMLVGMTLRHRNVRKVISLKLYEKCAHIEKLHHKRAINT